MATFHEILNELRVSKGVTQEEVANAIGVAKSTFAKYDRGEREPNFATLVKIAQYFDTTTDYLLGLSQVAHPIKTRQMAVDIPVDFALTSTEDEIMQIAQDFLSALGPAVSYTHLDVYKRQKYEYHYKHYQIFHSNAPFQGQDLTAYRWRGSTVPVV